MYFLRSGRDSASLQLQKKIENFLSKNNLQYEKGADFDNIHRINPEHILIIGSDSQILSAFNELGPKQIPLLGISTGASVLSEANSANYKSIIQNIEKGEYTVQERTRLVAHYNSSTTPFALNEIGIFPKRSAELVRYTLSIDNEHIFKDTADGVIVSTPTGSTGYAVSAGGPMVIDEPAIFTITPISSMHRSYPPLVVPNASTIRISGIQSKSSVCAIVDGMDRITLDCDSISIVKSGYPALFIIPKYTQSIVDKLKKRSLKTNHDRIKFIPPSAKLIYKVLTYEGGMTQKEIIRETYLPPRTVRYALDLLSKNSIIKRSPNLNDIRQTVYSV